MAEEKIPEKKTRETPRCMEMYCQGKFWQSTMKLSATHIRHWDTTLINVQDKHEQKIPRQA